MHNIKIIVASGLAAAAACIALSAAPPAHTSSGETHASATLSVANALPVETPTENIPQIVIISW